MFRPRRASLPKPATSSNYAKYRQRKKRSLSDVRPNGRKRLWLLLRLLALLVASIVLFLLFLRLHPPSKQAVEDFIRYTSDDLGLRSDKRKSLKLRRDSLERLWGYEVFAGHYPFSALPNKKLAKSLARLDVHLPLTSDRVYTNISQARRTPSEAVLDLEHVWQECALENRKYVVDCLALLSGKKPDPSLLYLPTKRDIWSNVAPAHPFPDIVQQLSLGSSPKKLFKSSFPLQYTEDWEPGCLEVEQPKIFHIFWTGPFTDKPYMAALAFLATQRLSLHDPSRRSGCPPRLMFWLVPGSAYSSVRPAPDAQEQLMRSLQRNKWALPLLDERFKPFLSFHIFNTTEQLDATPELKDAWRKLALFRSGPKFAAGLVEDDPLLQMAGSVSATQYDRLAVILSDMARFVLCHRFGGIYLDADTLLLRDFEELFNWPGAFAYRWSRMREYNSAVLKMNRGSALGSFILRTALANELDFHPHSIWQYLSKTDPAMDGLLLRAPDALFDPAWLNTEYYQRDRPPSPFFRSFDEFFQPRAELTNSDALTHEAFFNGAYAYHYHNNWWTPFDPVRDFPDIGFSAFAIGSTVEEDGKLSWGAALKRQWEAFLRGEVPNMLGPQLPLFPNHQMTVVVFYFNGKSELYERPDSYEMAIALVRQVFRIHPTKSVHLFLEIKERCVELGDRAWIGVDHKDFVHVYVEPEHDQPQQQQQQNGREEQRPSSLHTLLNVVSFTSTSPLTSPIPRRPSRSQILNEYNNAPSAAPTHSHGPFPSPPITPTSQSPPVAKRRSVRFSEEPKERSVRSSSVPLHRPAPRPSLELTLSHPPLLSHDIPMHNAHPRKRSQSQVLEQQEVSQQSLDYKRAYRLYRADSPMPVSR